jgi:hypothetical protein
VAANTNPKAATAQVFPHILQIFMVSPYQRFRKSQSWTIVTMLKAIEIPIPQAAQILEAEPGNAANWIWGYRPIVDGLHIYANYCRFGCKTA